jgi:hypothetical protein
MARNNNMGQRMLEIGMLQMGRRRQNALAQKMEEERNKRVGEIMHGLALAEKANDKEQISELTGELGMLDPQARTKWAQQYDYRKKVRAERGDEALKNLDERNASMVIAAFGGKKPKGDPTTENLAQWNANLQRLIGPALVDYERILGNELSQPAIQDAMERLQALQNMPEEKFKEQYNNAAYVFETHPKLVTDYNSEKRSGQQAAISLAKEGRAKTKFDQETNTWKRQETEATEDQDMQRTMHGLDVTGKTISNDAARRKLEGTYPGQEASQQKSTDAHYQVVSNQMDEMHKVRTYGMEDEKWPQKSAEATRLAMEYEAAGQSTAEAVERAYTEVMLKYQDNPNGEGTTEPEMTWTGGNTLLRGRKR